jgi:hypothetical protein
LQLGLTVSFIQCYIEGVSVIDPEALRQVPGSVIGMSRTASDAVAAFADVVYADQQWVDAEFAELVATSFGEPPAPPPPAPPQVPPLPGTPPPPRSQRPVPGPAVLVFPAVGPARGRQRSPPPRPGRRPAAAPGR